MRFRFTTKKGKFISNDDLVMIPWNDLHSFDDYPAYEDFHYNVKYWAFEGKYHRLSGPARIADGEETFWINGIKYSFEEWCEYNPNKSALVIYLLKN